LKKVIPISKLPTVARQPVKQPRQSKQAGPTKPSEKSSSNVDYIKIEPLDDPPRLEEIEFDDHIPENLEESLLEIEKLAAQQLISNCGPEGEDIRKSRGRPKKKNISREVNTALEKKSVYQIRDYLTVDKYVPPRMSKTIHKNDRNVACLVFGEEKAIELGLAKPRKLSGGRQSSKKSHSKNSSKKPPNTDLVRKMANKRQRSSKANHSSSKKSRMSNKKWSGTCHVFYVDSANSRNWKPSPEGSSGGSAVHIVDDLIRTFQNDKIVEEIPLSNESIVACTSPKFVQLNASDNGTVWGFGFRKEDDRQSFQNCLNTIVETAKSLMKETSIEENKLKNENDRLKQRQMLKEDEIKDLREKKLKLELEIKETKQREQMLQKRSDDLQERNEKLEEENCKMRKLLKDAENEIRMQDLRLMEQKVVQDPAFIRKITESTRLLNRLGIKKFTIFV